MVEEFHNTVLKTECIDYLNLRNGCIYVDATLGGGGHTQAMLRKNKNIKVYCFDQDDDALEFSKIRLKDYEPNIIFIKDNFVNFRTRLALLRVDKIDGIIFDLGVSQFQLLEAKRGFSFSLEGELDMRMDKNGPVSAKNVINELPWEELRQVFWNYGEEREADRIAKEIDRVRKKRAIKTTKELAEIIETSTKSPFKIKAKARVFLALRILINGEIEKLEKTLLDATNALKTNGRMLAISYHSIEDRIIKNFMRYQQKECVCPPQFPKCICEKVKKLNIITKRPVVPSDEEISSNNKARSAKLRVAEKV